MVWATGFQWKEFRMSPQTPSYNWTLTLVRNPPGRLRFSCLCQKSLADQEQGQQPGYTSVMNEPKEFARRPRKKVNQQIQPLLTVVTIVRLNSLTELDIWCHESEWSSYDNRYEQYSEDMTRSNPLAETAEPEETRNRGCNIITVISPSIKNSEGKCNEHGEEPGCKQNIKGNVQRTWILIIAFHGICRAMSHRYQKEPVFWSLFVMI